MKINKKYEEYITNKEQVEHIINQCEYDIKLNTKTQHQYNYTFFINDLMFTYFEGIGNEPLTTSNKDDKMLNALYCLLGDRQCMINLSSEYDFICEYGYNGNSETMAKGHKIYNDILTNNKKLLKAFNNEQLDFLTDNIQL